MRYVIMYIPLIKSNNITCYLFTHSINDIGMSSICPCRILNIYLLMFWFYPLRLTAENSSTNLFDIQHSTCPTQWDADVTSLIKDQKKFFFNSERFLISSAGYFYSVKDGSSIITSKVCQKISVMKANTALVFLSSSRQNVN